ncbi:MAG TPA: hypothetical protein VK010_04340 [Flavobacteriaceae bacterium]|nr:hypothetical protein [Flavobacteriaceae bacterium]
MIKKLILILLIAFTISCSEDSSLCCAGDSTGIEISVVGENGQDLLNPENPEAYQEGEIELKYKINGEIEKAYHSLEGAKGVRIVKHESEYRISIILNYFENEEKPTTYIQWNATDIDTIQAEFRRWGGNNIVVEKVWYNDDLKNHSYFQIEK